MSSQKPPRRLFNRPTWAANSHSSSASSGKPIEPGNDDFFSRAEHTFSAVAAAAEEERAKKREARKAKGLVEVSLRSPSAQDEDPSPKRRRVSGEKGGITGTTDKARIIVEDIGEYDDDNDDGEDDDDFDDDRKRLGTRSKEREEARAVSPALEQPYLQSQTASQTPDDGDGDIVLEPKETTKPCSNIAVELSDDDEIEVTVAKNGATTEEEAYASSEDEDDEFAELARQAREKSRRKLLEGEAAGGPSSETKGTGGTSGVELVNPVSPAEHVGSSSPVAEPIVSFCITSDIPNTKPLIIKRTLRQRLKEARLYWCNRHQLPTREIILTWKGQVWFDSLSAQDFGIGVDENGELLPKGLDGWPERDPYRGNIHLVAMTEEQYEETRNKKLGAHEDEAQISEEAKFRVVLRAKGYVEQKLIVLPSTTIQKMIDAFAQKSNVPRSKKVVLMFDGELLQPNSTVGQTDIEDMVAIDVHIR